MSTHRIRFVVVLVLSIATQLHAQFLERDVRIIRTHAGTATFGNFGAWINNVGDTNGDGVADLIVGSPGRPATNGAAFLYSGRDGALLHTFRPDLSRGQFGISVSGAGDLNGDGAGDILVGAPEASSRAGAVYVYSGRDGTLLRRLDGEAAGDEFGFAPGAIEDLNDDRIPDFLVGAPGASSGTGRVYIYSGADRSLIRKVEGRASGERFGSGVNSLGDVTGDRLPELIVGAMDGAPNRGGHVYVFSSQTREPLYEVPADATSVHMGWAFVSTAGDVNRDGSPDLLVGDFGNNGAGADAGRAWVFDGRTGAQLLVWNGSAGSGLGETRPAGDVNGDGYADLLIGAYNDNTGSELAGSVAVYSGRDGSALLKGTWTGRVDQFGVDVAPMGDVDGDGSADFAVSAPGSDINGAASGEVHIISGETIAKAGPSVTITSPFAGQSFETGTPIRVQLGNFTLDCAGSGGANVVGRGHLRIEVDSQLDSTPCTAETQLRGSYSAGSHVIRVKLVNNDGTLLSPPAEAAVTVTFAEKMTTDFVTDGLLVSSRFTDNILRFDANTGAFVGVFASGNGLDNPNGIAYGPDGHLYAGNGDVGRVLRFNGRTGAFIDTFVRNDPATPADESGGLTGSRGLAFGPNGDLYVDDGPNDRVLRYDGRTGAFIGVAAQGNGLRGPVGLSFGPDGTMYVGGALSGSAYAFKDGAFVRSYTCPSVGGITGVLIGPDGALYAASSVESSVVRFNVQTGQCLGQFATGGGLNIPIALAWAPDGNLLVGSFQSNSVIKYEAGTGRALGAFIAGGSGGLSGTHNFAFMPAAAAPAPTLTITTPQNGGTVSNGSSVTVATTNFTLDCAAGDNAAGFGKLRIEVDGQLNSESCQTTTRLFGTFAAGSHTIRVSLVNRDGTPLSPAVEATAVVTIAADPSFAPRLTVPGVARTAGAGGSFFRTSLWLTNVSSAPTTVRLRFVAGRGFSAIEHDSAIVQLPASNMVTFRDVLAEAFGTGRATAGVIVVDVPEGAAPLVTARTFNSTPAGTFGQYIESVSAASAAQSWIHGLGGDDQFRSNVGITNLSDQEISATVSVWNASGVRIGTDVPATVSARSSLQLNAVNGLAGVPRESNFSVRIDAPANASFSYASKLDNVTSDPIFVAPLPSRSRQWIDGVGAVAGAGGTFFRSALLLANEGASAARVNVAYTARGQSAPLRSVDVDLAPHQTRLYSDALKELFDLQDTAGTFTLTSADSTPFVAWARTYNDRGASGTLGQFIPSFGSENLIGANGALLQGLSHDPDVRTNLGIVNTGAVATDVTLTAYSGAGARLGAATHHLEATQSLFLGGAIRQMLGADATDIYLKVESTVPNAVYAWASYVDNRSTDQTFVRPLLLRLNAQQD